MEKGLLAGTEEEFSIPEENRQFLVDWVESNKKLLTLLMKIYENETDKEREKENERVLAIARKFKF